MMPLTKKEREKLERLFNAPSEVIAEPLRSMVRDLLADSAYWRSKIAEFEPIQYYGTYDERRCQFCNATVDCLDREDSLKAENHHDNCEWIAARDAQ